MASDPKLLVDALPYIDQGYDEAARTAALALIEEECKRYHPTKNYLSHLPEPKYDTFMTDLMKTEFDRIQQRQPMEMLNMKRYELPGPSAGKMTDLNAWQEAVNNAQAQLEQQETSFHERKRFERCEASITYYENSYSVLPLFGVMELGVFRLCNLELMEEYGAEAHKAFNDTLQKTLMRAQRDLGALRAQIQEIHLERKRKQTEAGDKLRGLETSWVSLVTKNYQIENACAQMEIDLAPLRKKFKTD